MPAIAQQAAAAQRIGLAARTHHPAQQGEIIDQRRDVQGEWRHGHQRATFDAREVARELNVVPAYHMQPMIARAAAAAASTRMRGRFVQLHGDMFFGQRGGGGQSANTGANNMDGAHAYQSA